MPLGVLTGAKEFVIHPSYLLFLPIEAKIDSPERVISSPIANSIVETFSLTGFILLKIEHSSTYI